MPNYHRPRVGGSTVFFTVNLADPTSTLLTDEVARLRHAVRTTRAAHPFAIDAWVVLPNHLHAVWTLPAGDADYPTRWRLIKARFAAGLEPADRRSASKRAKGEKGLWQRRYWEHHLRDEDSFAAAIRYCWTNPVKHGLVERPEDWPFSSVHRDRPLSFIP